MKRPALSLIIVFALALALTTLPSTHGRTGAPGQSVSYTPVVLISIDGLKPDYILEADKYGLKIPNFRRLVKEGAYAEGVKGVLPTVTYPTHTTMVTGVSPAKHGIVTNSPFDPFGKNQGGWYWYAEDIKSPTLWDLVAQAGKRSSSVDWPVTVGANITYNIAQYWRATTEDDRKLLRALSTKDILAEVERAVGPYPAGYIYTVEADSRRAAASAYLLESKKAHLHLAYFSVLDEEQHATGPYTPQVFATLEEVDKLIGQVRAAAEKAGNGRAYVCVVSDHGFAKTDQELHLNAALREAGLLEVGDNKRVKSWQAYAWYAGGAAGIMLKEPDNEDVKRRVGEVLRQLAADAASGIDRLFEREEAKRMGGFPEAAFVVTMKKGYRLGNSLDGAVRVGGRVGGTHGFAPTLAEMNASFFLIGPQIPANKNLGLIDMRDIAPTLAGLLGLTMPTAEGRDVLKK